MKALSIRSDYVMDIFQGAKTVEYRSWSTNYRGDLLICGTAKKVHGGIPGYATCVAKKSRALNNTGSATMVGG